RPFGAKYGQSKAAWERVIDYLNEYDKEQFRKLGASAVFEGVTVRLCQAKWDTLSREYKQYETRLDRASGVAPEVNERLILIQAIYDYEQACTKALQEVKRNKEQDKQRAQGDREAGRALLDASMTGPTRERAENEAETSESLSPAKRKRAFVAELNRQYADTVEHAKRQLTLQEKQIELLEEERVNRQREEERHKENADENRQRHKESTDENRKLHKESIDEDQRRHREMLDMMKQQNETQQSLVQALLKLAERK
ncbi:hypothetical protein BGW38_008737, partial [Lunasporangiospora selenospora]